MTGDPIPWYMRADYWHRPFDPLDDWDQSWSNITIQSKTIPLQKIDYKFKEDITFKEVMDYINSTYEAHYSEKGGVQTLDYIMANSESLDFLKGNAIKYLARYGKKEGKNKKDLFKAIHYIILLHYYSENNPNE
jgi:hypothetical protein